MLFRSGCTLAHDHPGLVSTFPLAISLESPQSVDYIRRVYDVAGLALPPAAELFGFHDLGFYEFLFLSLIVVPAFAYLSRRPRPAGFYLATFATLYLPIRFGLEMLRVADARYLGLTPAQWVAAVITAALPFATLPYRKLRLALSGAVIQIGRAHV